MSIPNTSPKIPAARTRLHEPVQPIDPDFDDVGTDADKIQKGMPSRNLKMGLSMLALVGLAAYLLFPSLSPKKNPEPPPMAVAPKTDLVQDLVSAKPNPQSEPPQIAENLSGPPVPPAPPQAQGPSLEDERKLAALLSSTEGSDVSIRSKSPIPGSAGSDITSMIASQQANAERMMRENQEFAQRMMDQSNAAAVTAGQQGQELFAQASRNPHDRFISSQSQTTGLGPAVKLDPARSKHTLYEGTLIRTVLTRAIKTDLPGMVTAKVTTDLYDTVSQRVLLVPRGSEITCTYQSELMVGQELVLAACNRLRLPNGKSFALNGATASDMQGASGLPAEINNHFWKMFKTALIVGAASKLLPKEDQRISSNESASGNVSTGGSILGTALNTIVQSTMSRNLLISPTGSVDIGTPFTLTISRDVELEPYLR